MKFNKSFIAVAMIMGFGVNSAYAADGTINFTGLVVASACTAVASVNANGTEVPGPAPVTATLALPTVHAKVLNAAPNTYVGQTPFSIKLTGCTETAALHNVRAEFTSAATPADNNYVMANTASGSSASNVAVAIMQRNGTQRIDLHNGQAKDPGAILPSTTGDVTLDYKAAYMSLNTGVTPGTVVASADFVISYF
jgi:major type 1 subunit fimbrin (pilin)